jgi:Fe-S cluster biosynthesis and repair protein YggX
MTQTLECSRCGQQRKGLDAAPSGGPIGKLVQENICQDCWKEWRETSALLINHHGLVLGNPQHRQQLRMAMLQFLSLDEDAPAVST